MPDSIRYISMFANLRNFQSSQIGVAAAFMFLAFDWPIISQRETNYRDLLLTLTQNFHHRTQHLTLLAQKLSFGRYANEPIIIVIMIRNKCDFFFFLN